ncbi:MAG: hypothetical protein HKN03_07315 [Acidimicrobiales bacterium]|nr:hypothetical protein [Acidimicrobiales bacterium]
MNLKHGIAAAALTLALLAPAGTAAAAPPEIHHWTDSDTQPFTFCSDLDIMETYNFSGSTRIVKHGKNGLQYFTETFRGSIVWTNQDTGRSFRMEQAGVDKDAKVVDNGDGTLTIIVLATGTTRFYDNSGRMVFSENGQIRFEVLVDHNGTPDDYTDDGDGVFQGIVKPSTGTNGTDGRDFCDDLAYFTG